MISKVFRYGQWMRALINLLRFMGTPPTGPRKKNRKPAKVKVYKVTKAKKDWDIHLPGDLHFSEVTAHTKSEARSIVKKKLLLKRLPEGTRCYLRKWACRITYNGLALEAITGGKHV